MWRLDQIFGRGYQEEQSDLTGSDMFYYHVILLCKIFSITNYLLVIRLSSKYAFCLLIHLLFASRVNKNFSWTYFILFYVVERNEVTIYICVCLNMYLCMYICYVYVLHTLYWNYFFFKYFTFLFKYDIHTEKYVNCNFKAL